MAATGNVTYLGLGSNMGDRAANLRAAIDAIGRLPSTVVLSTSGVYESAPWGPVEQPDYLNLVIAARTALEPLALLAACKAIERELGRVPGVRWGPRPVDIDILLYDDVMVQDDDLQIPHPRMWERAFVLRPLAELAPHLRDPHGAAIIEVLAQQAISSQDVRPYRAPGAC